MAGAAVDEMVELLCANLQKDELAALNTSMSAEGLSQKQQQDMVKVRSFGSSFSTLCSLCDNQSQWQRHGCPEDVQDCQAHQRLTCPAIPIASCLDMKQAD